ncbi:MAG: energy-coupling factor transporter transmembrane component T [Tissierellia bacterium]|nr:energy-coupling factor transporter transmembrane component T [Tissierellia bacterium]
MRSSKALLKFDPRSKLLLIITMGFLIITSSKLYLDYFAVALLFLLFVLDGRYISGIKFVIAFFLLSSIDLYLPHDIKIFQVVIKPLAFIIRMFMLPIVAFNYTVNSTDISNLMSSLEKLKLPKAIVIPIAVMIRFFPALKQDYYYIKNSMKMRGIGLGLNSIKNPLLTMEYIMIPLLASASELGDELTAAAHTKGADNPGPKNRYNDSNFAIQDYLLIIVLLLMGGYSIWLRIMS